MHNEKRCKFSFRGFLDSLLQFNKPNINPNEIKQSQSLNSSPTKQPIPKLTKKHTLSQQQIHILDPNDPTFQFNLFQGQNQLRSNLSKFDSIAHDFNHLSNPRT